MTVFFRRLDSLRAMLLGLRHPNFIFIALQGLLMRYVRSRGALIDKHIGSVTQWLSFDLSHLGRHLAR